MICCLIGTSLSASHLLKDIPPVENMRLSGMAGAYTAVADDYNALFHNPAGLANLRNRSLGINVHYVDDAVTPFFSSPSVKPEFYFSSPGWGAGISSSFYVMEQEGGDYTIHRINSADLGFAFGIGMISFGTSLHASKKDTITGVELGGPGSPDFLMDFFTQVFLNAYDTNDAESEESVMLKAGFLFDTGIIAAGVSHGSLFDIMAWSENQELPGFDDVFGGFHAGVSLRNSRLNRFGGENMLRIRGALDMKYIGSDNRRTIHAGLEAAVHLAQVGKVSLRAGYSEKLPNAADLLTLSLDPNEGTFTFGAGIDFLVFSLQAAAEIPGSVLFDQQGTSRLGFSAGFTF